MGKYGKGIINSSGKRLLEACKTNELILTNTLFQHKKSHRTTWTAPFRNFITRTGEERRNPVRNQIDYIITRKQHRGFVTDSRSYGGIRTNTDHKLVKASFRVEWYKLKNKTKKTKRKKKKKTKIKKIYRFQKKPKSWWKIAKKKCLWIRINAPFAKKDLM